VGRLQLPNLQPRAGATEDSEWKREGWDRRGARSRLDRRRSLKESVKRRALDADSPAFTDEDLRYRQLTRRRQPALRAAVFFLLDVSGSMSDRDRQLAKTFFFWVAAGLRRQYKALDIVFVAHTTEAWEFSEADFFKVAGSGGTVASVGLARFARSWTNASIPDPATSTSSTPRTATMPPDDRDARGCRARGDRQGARYAAMSRSRRSAQLAQRNHDPVRGRRRGRSAVRPLFRRDPDDIAGAVRHFFTAEAHAGDADAAGATP
jgi:hypothetical protein